MKKTAYILLIILLSNTVGFAQFEVKMSYNYARPLGEMAINIQRSHGINFEGLYRFKKMPLLVGLEFGFAGYGHQKERQTYTFTDGSQTETDVHVYNNILNFNLTTQFELLSKSPIKPYVQAKIGMSRFYTDLIIDDPEDIDDCHPLEQDILLSNVGLVGGAGLGIKWDLASVFGKMNKNRFYLDVNANYLTGSKVKYMSVNAPTPEMMPVDDVNAEFLNRQNQVVHRHHVGYVYESKIELIEYRFGMMMRF